MVIDQNLHPTLQHLLDLHSARRRVPLWRRRVDGSRGPNPAALVRTMLIYDPSCSTFRLRGGRSANAPVDALTAEAWLRWGRRHIATWCAAMDSRACDIAIAQAYPCACTCETETPFGPNPNGYAVDARGIIRSPGQFYGEPLYAPWAYGIVADMAGDDINPGIIRLTGADRARFPGLLMRRRTLQVWREDDGCVYVF